LFRRLLILNLCEKSIFETKLCLNNLYISKPIIIKHWTPRLIFSWPLSLITSLILSYHMTLVVSIFWSFFLSFFCGLCSGFICTLCFWSVISAHLCSALLYSATSVILFLLLMLGIVCHNLWLKRGSSMMFCMMFWHVLKCSVMHEFCN
jgi:hypothetical protein